MPLVFTKNPTLVSKTAKPSKADSMSKTTNQNFNNKTEPPEVTIYHDTAQWLIAFYQTDADGKRHRIRQTFNLNRTKDKTHRGQRAKWFAYLLEQYALPAGYPYTTTQFDTILEGRDTEGWLLPEAVRYAKELKGLKSKRKRSNDTFQNYVNRFVDDFLMQMGWLDKRLTEFGKRDAYQFIDWLQETGNCSDAPARQGQKLKGRTVNNYREGLRSLFGELVERELVDKNVWSNMGSVPEEEAVRRAMTTGERDALMAALYAEHPFLLLGVLMQYYCAIRPSEMRRLRFKGIDLEAGLIRLNPDETKNHQRGGITIPKPFLAILEAYNIGSFPSNYLVFGEHLQPHPDKACGRNTLSEKHRKVLRRLVAEGILKNADGIQFYSWKDTGGVDLIEDGVPINDIQQHFRHRSLDYTQRYFRQKRNVIATIRDRDNGVADAGKIKAGLSSFFNKKTKKT